MDDWADLSWVVQSVRTSGMTDTAELRRHALELIDDVLRGGLMVAGDINADGFHPWGTGSDESASRIEREWTAGWGDAIPPPGAVVWLSNTDAGDALAREVLRREAHS
ncbi:hypothetical protein [Microbacterium mangrovi]|uniref:hypothetical protein n=1 Tax=Microbacterium mangrovi TaxID=1348253 RepID=UPI0012E013FD|nr:hypothetical protein [Microbacterium mangrovi]